MIPLEAKVRPLLAKIQSSGDVDLFGVFEREDGKWDILVSSDWSDKDPDGVIRELAQDLVASLSKEELILVSRIVVIPSDAPAVTALSLGLRVEGDSVHVEDFNLFGLQTNRGVVFWSMPRSEQNNTAEPTAPIGLAQP
jgi:hypothetical protein